MTINFSVGELSKLELADAAYDILTDTAKELASILRSAKADKGKGANESKTYIRDVRAALILALEERSKLEKIRTEIAGVVGTTELDFHAARDEIGRRLACLRDAGPGG